MSTKAMAEVIVGIRSKAVVIYGTRVTGDKTLGFVYRLFQVGGYRCEKFSIGEKVSIPLSEPCKPKFYHATVSAGTSSSSRFSAAVSVNNPVGESGA